jgi:hypothetical protein
VINNDVEFCFDKGRLTKAAKLQKKMQKGNYTY